MLHKPEGDPTAALPGPQPAQPFARGRALFPNRTTRVTVERDSLHRGLAGGELLLIDLVTDQTAYPPISLFKKLENAA